MILYSISDTANHITKGAKDMRISKGYVKTAFRVTEKKTGERYDCFIQDYEYMDGKHATRFNIGINGWNEWSFCYYLNEAEFNEQFTID